MNVVTKTKIEKFPCKVRVMAIQNDDSRLIASTDRLAGGGGEGVAQLRAYISLECRSKLPSTHSRPNSLSVQPFGE